MNIEEKVSALGTFSLGASVGFALIAWVSPPNTSVLLALFGIFTSGSAIASLLIGWWVDQE